MKYSILYGHLHGSIQFLTFENFTWFLGRAKVWVQILILGKCLKWTFGKGFGKFQVQSGDKFQSANNLGTFILNEKKKPI